MKALLSLVILSGLLGVSPPATADLIGVAKTGPSSRIDFFSEAGACVGNAKKAEFVGERGVGIPGCWVPAEKGLFVVFFDGDYAYVHMSGITQPKPA